MQNDFLILTVLILFFYTITHIELISKDQLILLKDNLFYAHIKYVVQKPLC